MSNVLVAYFSASGVTKNVAEKIADENGYDLFEIKPVEPYTAADLDYTNKESRSTIEMNDKEFRPPIVESCDVSQYDTVVIGFPVWWYTAPTIINTFLETYDFSGKNVVFFATSGGSTVDKANAQFKEQYPAIKWTAGKVLNRATDEDVKAWVESLKF